MFHARWTIDQLTETTATVLVSTAPTGPSTAVRVLASRTSRRVSTSVRSGTRSAFRRPGPTQAVVLLLELREDGPQAEAMAGDVRDASNRVAKQALLAVEGAAQREVWEEQPFHLDRDVLNEAISLRLTDSFRLAEVRPSQDEAPAARLSDLEPVVLRDDPLVRPVREGDVFWVEHPDARLYASLFGGDLEIEGLRVWDVTALARRQSKELFERVLVREQTPERGR
ncbi:MAG: hypothetical protein R3C39_06795 [Dehalococcoidia bacterium]